MAGIVTEMIQILVSGITQYAQGFGSGLMNVIKAIFLDGEGTSTSPYKLSVVGGIVCAFAAVSLAIGLTRLVFTWVTSLGASK